MQSKTKELNPELLFLLRLSRDDGGDGEVTHRQSEETTFKFAKVRAGNTKHYVDDGYTAPIAPDFNR